MKLLYKLYILTILLLGSFFSLAQNPAISGKVTDAETKKPLTGVSIYVKGKIYGTVSDAQGNFNLNISPPATLVISMIGYKRVEIAASTSPMNLSMQPSSEELDQVVISASRIEENILRSPVSIEKWISGPFSKVLQRTTSTDW
ncbi:carboxypeptidase-like regulatory domain-containing protein [Pseudarcicella hirudinis]|uniref:carboxypeptidase-like regulatory domain-containing protein n=1 Tax=Pseudarcicella hirudinis TaxID=1079859 RepID=UPI0035EA3A4D